MGRSVYKAQLVTMSTAENEDRTRQAVQESIQGNITGNIILKMKSKVISALNMGSPDSVRSEYRRQYGIQNGKAK